MSDALSPTIIVAAVIEHNGKYFVARRSPAVENPGLWEFPGGKLNVGESPEQGIIRELAEEFSVGAEVRGLLGIVDEVVNDRPLRLICLSVLLEKEPKVLKDHDQIAWVSFADLARLAMTPLDLAFVKLLSGEAAHTKEITRVDVRSCATLYGMMYAVIGIFVGLLMLFTPAALGPLHVQGTKSSVVIILVAAFMPIAHFIMGAMAGATLAWIYNIFAGTFGGIKIRWK